MSTQASWYAVTRFNVATFGANARAQGVPPFAVPYFTNVLSDLLTEAREAAEFDAEVERLAEDPEIRALWNQEEP